LLLPPSIVAIASVEEGGVLYNAMMAEGRIEIG
jgi:hypothetical protein